MLDLVFLGADAGARNNAGVSVRELREVWLLVASARHDAAVTML